MLGEKPEGQFNKRLYNLEMQQTRCREKNQRANSINDFTIWRCGTSKDATPILKTCNQSSF
jgi:hypothetical protein